MARVTQIDELNHPELAGLIGKIRGERGGRLLNFYRALLHSPPLAATWLDLNNAVRRQTKIDGRVCELVIMRVALLNRADYVLNIREHFSEREIVELTVLIAAYNMHTRMLMALQVDPEEG